ncbi:unnamed protein product, partial [Phaeothamnion confervicola]
AGVTVSDVIADVGCGDGRVLLAAAAVIGCRGIGIDVSPECIAVARESSSAAGVSHLL